MRKDFTQIQLWLKYKKLKMLKQMLAEKEERPDPVDRAIGLRSIGIEIQEVEQEIDEIMRRA